MHKKAVWRTPPPRPLLPLNAASLPHDLPLAADGDVIATDHFP
jgi:hypothetical protein